MWENDRKFHKHIVGIAACFAAVMLVMGLVGCSTDRNNQSAANPNGVSTPVDPLENTTYTVAKQALVLAGVNGNGVPDTHSACDFTVTINEFPYVVDAEVELRWNESDYPGREVCFAAPGVTWTYSNGVHKLKAYTDAYGTAHFRAAGWFSGTISCSNPDNSTYRDGRIFVDGQELTPPSGGWFLVATADLGYAGGVDEEDAEEMEEDIFCGQYYFSRSDLNGSGATNSADLSILLSIIEGGGSIATCNE